MRNQRDPQVRERAQAEIAHLNALLSELLDQPGHDHQTHLWAQLMAQVRQPDIFRSGMLPCHPEESR